MKVRKTNVYDFSELSDEAKENAVLKLADVNIFSDWYENVYYDAEYTALLKITGFDIDRGSYCKGDFIEDAESTAQKIMSEHGKDCETLQTAREYMQNREKLVAKYSDGINTDIVDEDNEYDFDNDCDELGNEFLRSILEDYRIILSKEYDYLTSKEAITETIEANEYEFDVNGNRI